MSKKKKILYLTVIIILGIVLFTEYIVISISSKRKHEIAKEKAKIEEKYRLEEEQEHREELKELKRQAYLQDCINDAKQNRSDLWKANQDNNGRVNHETIKWIEERYQSDVDICKSMYKK